MSTTAQLSSDQVGGAIRVSGGSVDHDIAVVQAGVAAFAGDVTD